MADNPELNRSPASLTRPAQSHSPSSTADAVAAAADGTEDATAPQTAVHAQERVVLTSLDAGDYAVLAIPYSQALAALTTWSTLSRASTFGQVRRDADAAALVEDWLDLYLQREADEGRHSTGADEEDFDAEEFFGDDWFGVWTPSARGLTAAFLLKDEPTLAAQFLRPDPSWGFDDDPQPRITPQDRDALEATLEDRGYAVRRFDVLATLFLDPPADPAAALAASQHPNSGRD